MSKLTFHPTKSAIEGDLRSFKLTPDGIFTDVRSFLELLRPQIHQQLVGQLLDLGSIKLNLALKVILVDEMKTIWLNIAKYKLFKGFRTLSYLKY